MDIRLANKCNNDCHQNTTFSTLHHDQIRQRLRIDDEVKNMSTGNLLDQPPALPEQMQQLCKGMPGTLDHLYGPSFQGNSCSMQLPYQRHHMQIRRSVCGDTKSDKEACWESAPLNTIN